MRSCWSISPWKVYYIDQCILFSTLQHFFFCIRWQKVKTLSSKNRSKDLTSCLHLTFFLQNLLLFCINVSRFASSVDLYLKLAIDQHLLRQTVKYSFDIIYHLRLCIWPKISYEFWVSWSIHINGIKKCLSQRSKRNQSRNHYFANNFSFSEKKKK